MPKRIQMSRQRPWRAENPDAVIVARPSKWGNPLRVVRTECSLGGLCWAVALGQMVVQQHLDSDQRARELAVSFFRSWMDEDDHHDLPDPSELRGRDLACWCPPAHPCHADVLLELANGPDDEGVLPRNHPTPHPNYTNVVSAHQEGAQQ